ncbi:hypothetical protein THI4931_10170 [Pandoraea sputorum]|nr:hypothetical protein THI4931_10170 [Pandoraea sputorum]
MFGPPINAAPARIGAINCENAACNPRNNEFIFLRFCFCDIFGIDVWIASSAEMSPMVMIVERTINSEKFNDSRSINTIIIESDVSLIKEPDKIIFLNER